MPTAWSIRRRAVQSRRAAARRLGNAGNVSDADAIVTTAWLEPGNGFRPRGAYTEAQLDAIVKELYDAEGEALARLAAGEQQALDRILAGEQQPDNAPVDFKAQWMVLIECATETEQVDLLQRFLDEGLKCLALVS